MPSETSFRTTFSWVEFERRSTSLKSAVQFAPEWTSQAYTRYMDLVMSKKTDWFAADSVVSRHPSSSVEDYDSDSSLPSPASSVNLFMSTAFEKFEEESLMFSEETVRYAVYLLLFFATTCVE